MYVAPIGDNEEAVGEVPKFGVPVAGGEFFEKSFLKTALAYSERRGLHRGVDLYLSQEGSAAINKIVQKYCDDKHVLVIMVTEDRFHRLRLTHDFRVGTLLRLEILAPFDHLNEVSRKIRLWIKDQKPKQNKGQAGSGQTS